MLCEEEQEPELWKSEGETKQVGDDDDDELILVGVEDANEDADVIFVGMTSASKPVVSNILNRDTPGSCSRRNRYGHFRKGNAHKLQPVSHVTPTSEAKLSCQFLTPNQDQQIVLLLLNLRLKLIIKIFHHK